MKSYIDDDFLACYRHLSKAVQRQARAKYRLFKKDPYHPGLQFKLIDPDESLYSVRINAKYRALGIMGEGRIDWFWIGPHDEYDKLIASF